MDEEFRCDSWLSLLEEILQRGKRTHTFKILNVSVVFFVFKLPTTAFWTAAGHAVEHFCDTLSGIEIEF